MRKRKLLIWSLILAVLFVLYFTYSGITKKHVYVDEILLPEDIMKTFSVDLLDSVFIDNDLFTFVVTMDDCDICKLILFNKSFNNASCNKCFFNISSSAENATLAHLFCTKCFPTTYVINRSHEVVGVLEGVRDLERKLDSVLYLNQEINDCFIEGVENDSILPMLSYALQGLIDLKKRDYNSARKYVEKSLKSGSYVFNNYLSYLICKKDGLQDSIYFKDQVLSFRNSRMHVIYEKIIHQLSPGL